MALCADTAWLQVFGKEHLHLRDEKRMSRILAELKDPSRQRPTLQFFVGCQTRDTVLKELFPHNGPHGTRGQGFADLEVDKSTLASDFPTLFATSDPAVQVAATAPPQSCHAAKVHPLQRGSASVEELLPVIYARYFSIFSDVVCVFADDFENLQGMAKTLRAWSKVGCQAEIRPHLLIVMRGDKVSPTYNVMENDEIKVGLREKGVVDFFLGLTILRLASEQVSPAARSLRLRAVLTRLSKEIRRIRKRKGWLFSASHLDVLYGDALEHLTRGSTEPFDFIASSRRAHPPLTDHAHHITNYTRLLRSDWPAHDCISILASCILLDAYPPGMHAFEPGMMFDKLYRPGCEEALDGLQQPRLTAHEASQLVRRAMKAAFKETVANNITTATYHRRNLHTKLLQWRTVSSNQTCLSCVRRRPEHVLSCGHSMCEVCLRLFGDPIKGIPFRFEIDQCLLCGSGRLQRTLMPPTAAPRILSIDGGGIGGVIPLEFLAKIEAFIGRHCFLQDFFDFAFGTSAGGLIVIGLFLRQWSASHCLEMFDSMARQMFSRPPFMSSPFKKIHHAVRSWLYDGYYEVDKLEAVLKKNFGTDQKIFDYTHDGAQAKVAITGNLVSDASPVIFANFNGVVVRESHCGYSLYRPDNACDEPRLWQIGRATSAAPVYFKAMEIPSLGLVQDGGLAHNNPTKLAAWEYRKVWPHHNRPDIVLSLGTGSVRNSGGTAGGCVPRLIRAFKSAIDGQRGWEDVYNTLDDNLRSSYYRLNVTLEGGDYSLDNADCMDELRSSARSQLKQTRECENVALALLTSSFFFEVIHVSAVQPYHCEGVIRCRTGPTTIWEAFKALNQTSWMFETHAGHPLGSYTPDLDACHHCGEYRKSVEFPLDHPTQEICIYLKDSRQRRWKASAFPKGIDWFIAQQHLNSVFGNPYHEVRTAGRLCCRAPAGVARRRSKRRHPDPETTSRKKARSLRD